MIFFAHFFSCNTSCKSRVHLKNIIKTKNAAFNIFHNTKYDRILYRCFSRWYLKMVRKSVMSVISILGQLFIFRIDNCIFDESSSKVLAVLDWELSTLGDPLSDLAYSCMVHHLPQNFPLFPGMNSSLPSIGHIIWYTIKQENCNNNNFLLVYFFSHFFNFFLNERKNEKDNGF